MSIRQQGGIFGRNPTFNNVTVGGILTVDQIVEKTGAAGITLDGVTLKDGNVVLVGGNGIDFSATSGTGTSELFDDYEEGTWTPAFEGTTSGALSFGTVAQATYCKIGNMIYANCYLTAGNLAAHNVVGSVKVSGLPYASDFASGMVNVALSNIFLVDASDTSITGYVESSYIRLTKGSGAVSLAGTDVVSSGTSGQIMLQIVYQQ